MLTEANRFVRVTAYSPLAGFPYIAYTGGTTGNPKGVVWRHEDIFFPQDMKCRSSPTVLRAPQSSTLRNYSAHAASRSSEVASKSQQGRSSTQTEGPSRTNRSGPATEFWSG
jgi:acyl-CoA synthetase (AMP-forming)/AMP-acid ligase II